MEPMAVDRTAGRRRNKRSGEARRGVEASTSRRRKQALEAGVGSGRRSGGRGQVSGKRRRNGQPIDDIVGDKKSIIGEEKW